MILFIPIIAVALLLGLAGPATAQTWPSDVTGRPAAQCATLDALGVPQLCGPSNPLSVTGGGPLTGAATGVQSAGQNWFLSNPPDFNPFVTPSGTTSGAVPFVFFLDDINVVAFSSGSVLQNIAQWRSSNAGQTWTSVAEANFNSNAAGLEGALKLATGGYVFVSGEISPNCPFFLSNDGIVFSRRTCTGIPSQVTHHPVGPNVNTILAHASGAGAANDTVCRSANLGSSWTCATMPAITSYTGAAFFTFTGSGGGAQPEGPQGLATVSSSTWLALGFDTTDTNMRILRSTNDGAGWTEVFRDTGITFPNPGVGGGVTCLTSTLCLAASSQRIFRSTDGGQTWSIVLTSGPNGGNTNWNGIAPFSSTVAVAIPFGGSSTGGFSRTVDGGLTWQPQPGGASCPRNTGVARGLGSLAVLDGRAVVISKYLTLSAGAPCAHYSTLGTGSTAVAGPLGVPWAIDARGFGPVFQPDTLTPFTVAPVEGINLFNSQTTGAANASVTVTITAAVNQRAHLYRLEASCSGGSTQITVQDAATIIWQTLSTEVGANARFRQPFSPTALTTSTNSTMTITMSSCGVGNTATLIVHADRY